MSKQHVRCLLKLALHKLPDQTSISCYLLCIEVRYDAFDLLRCPRPSGGCPALERDQGATTAAEGSAAQEPTPESGISAGYQELCHACR